jgi:hypothetical protein
MQITAEITPQGLLIPLSVIQAWLERGIDVLQTDEKIIIQPKPLSERERIARILTQAGLRLVQFDEPGSYSKISEKKRAELIRKFSIGRPLSEIVIEEREQGW